MRKLDRSKLFELQLESEDVSALLDNIDRNTFAMLNICLSIIAEKNFSMIEMK